MIEAQNTVREFIARALQKGRDYGVIPGTGDKPTLLKPGSERVVIGMGCYFGAPTLIEQEVDHDREVQWTKRKKKWHNRHQGDKSFAWEEEHGTSLGLYRYVVSVPIIHRESGETVGVGVGSCSTMESKYVDRPRDSENTVLKMAHKRAMICATLAAFGLSEQFTQDLEDFHAPEAEAVRVAERGATPEQIAEINKLSAALGHGVQKWANERLSGALSEAAAATMLESMRERERLRKAKRQQTGDTLPEDHPDLAEAPA
jgi:hypothetical protein